jgi:DNA-binding Lrp family transcriptional regulator
VTTKYKNLQHFFHYRKFLDRVNAAILEGLAECGPRNLSVLAKSLSLPVTTVRFRLNKMIKNGLLLVNANLNMPKLGLIRGFLAAEAFLGRQDALFKVILNSDYWTYIIRCFGKVDGYCAYFAFPFEYETELQKYFEEAARMKIFSNHKFFWITNSMVFPPNFSWYDFDKREWRFQWEKWVAEVLQASSMLPQILKDPEDYSVMVDKIDLLILKELEKNGNISLKELTKVVKITPQSIGYRFKNRITKKNLIVNYNIDAYPYPMQVSDLCNFKIGFADEEKLAKFVNASNRKPFMVSCAKIIGENSSIANIYIPKMEFPNLIKSLNRLYSEGVIKNFTYVTLDPKAYKRQTISYEYFESGKWTYDAEEKIKKLKEIGQEA